MQSVFDYEERPTAPNLSWCNLTPRDYQQAGINRAFELWDQGQTGVIFRQPTGTGKTISGIAIADLWLQRSEQHRVIVIAHERQLIWQFAQEIEDVMGFRPGIEMANEKVAWGDPPLITVASRASLFEKLCPGGMSTESRLYKFDPLKYKFLVVCDECHRWAYKLRSCKHIIEWFERGPDNRRLGLTATPERGDRTSLRRLFPSIASDYRLYDPLDGPSAVRDGWAVSYDQRFITVEGIDFKNLREVGGDFDEGELERILSERETLLRLIRPTLDLVGDKRTLIFSPTVAMAKAVAHTINAETGDDHRAKSLDGSVPDYARREVYRDHQCGAFQFLSVVGLCREGYNDPGIQAVAIYRPTKSRTLAEQMKGRGCRPLRGLVDGLASAEERLAAIAASAKPSCMVIDMVGVSGLADTATTAHILAQGLPDEDKIVRRVNQRALEAAESGDSLDIGEAIKSAKREIDAEKAEAARKAREAQEALARAKARLAARIQADVRYSAHQVEQGHGAGAVRGQRGAYMPFGKYRGWKITDMPSGYLRWLKENTPNLPKWLVASVDGALTARGATGPEPATAKQIGWLKWRRQEIPRGLTKYEASRLIQDCMKENQYG